MERYANGDLVFDVADHGPADGPVTVLLHGFPQTNTCWHGVIPALTAQGYRCLAPNQRGYSPRARPRRRRDYRLAELVDDVRALIDAVGVQRVHLVGHDWGSVVAWLVAAEHPDRLASLTAVSVPHPAAFLRAVATSRQIFASWYMAAVQVPRLPELVMLGGAGSRLAWGLARSGLASEFADRDARAMSEPGALRAALNWYRGIPLSSARGIARKVSVPTTFVWSDDDVAITEASARLCARYVSGEYRRETLKGSHWIPDEHPDELAAMLSTWFSAHPV